MVASLRPRRTAVFALIGGAIAIAGCTRDTTPYPSLGVRAVEGRGFAEPAAAAPAVAAPDPAIDARLSALSDRLDIVSRGFATERQRAERAARAAAGRPVGSEPWLDAQAAIAGLDDRRAEASAITTDIEALAIDRAASLAPAYPALAALAARAADETAQQDAAIARLAGSLPAA